MGSQSRRALAVGWRGFPAETSAGTKLARCERMAAIRTRAGDFRLEALVVSAAGGDEKGWHALWCALQPRLSALLRRSGTPSRDDEIGDVVVAIMARLRADRFRRLHLYLTARRA